MLKIAVLGFIAAAVITGLSSPAAALCNKICQAKCKASWQSEFTSEKECLRVWSRRAFLTSRPL